MILDVLHKLRSFSVLSSSQKRPIWSGLNYWKDYSFTCFVIGVNGYCVSRHEGMIMWLELYSSREYYVAWFRPDMWQCHSGMWISRDKTCGYLRHQLTSVSVSVRSLNCSKITWHGRMTYNLWQNSQTDFEQFLVYKYFPFSCFCCKHWCRFLLKLPKRKVLKHAIEINQPLLLCQFYSFCAKRYFTLRSPDQTQEGCVMFGEKCHHW